MDALTRRINEMIAEMPDNLTLEEKTDIARNNLKIEKALGVTKGKPMTYEQANKGKENPEIRKRGRIPRELPDLHRDTHAQKVGV